jgi:hypothetical protein
MPFNFQTGFQMVEAELDGLQLLVWFFNGPFLVGLFYSNLPLNYFKKSLQNE